MQPFVKLLVLLKALKIHYSQLQMKLVLVHSVTAKIKIFSDFFGYLFVLLFCYSKQAYQVTQR